MRGVRATSPLVGTGTDRRRGAHVAWGRSRPGAALGPRTAPTARRVQPLPAIPRPHRHRGKSFAHRPQTLSKSFRIAPAGPASSDVSDLGGTVSVGRRTRQSAGAERSAPTRSPFDDASTPQQQSPAESRPRLPMMCKQRRIGNSSPPAIPRELDLLFRHTTRWLHHTAPPEVDTGYNPHENRRWPGRHPASSGSRPAAHRAAAPAARTRHSGRAVWAPVPTRWTADPRLGAGLRVRATVVRAPCRRCASGRQATSWSRLSVTAPAARGPAEPDRPDALPLRRRAAPGGVSNPRRLRPPGAVRLPARAPHPPWRARGRRRCSPSPSQPAPASSPATALRR